MAETTDRWAEIRNNRQYEVTGSFPSRSTSRRMRRFIIRDSEGTIFNRSLSTNFRTTKPFSIFFGTGTIRIREENIPVGVNMKLMERKLKGIIMNSEIYVVYRFYFGEWINRETNRVRLNRSHFDFYSSDD